MEVLSAALRASGLDTHTEAVGMEKSGELQDEPGINELQNCKINQDDSVPLISDAVEVTNPVALTDGSSLSLGVCCWGTLQLIIS